MLIWTNKKKLGSIILFRRFIEAAKCSRGHTVRSGAYFRASGFQFRQQPQFPEKLFGVQLALSRRFIPNGKMARRPDQCRPDLIGADLGHRLLLLLSRERQRDHARHVRRGEACSGRRAGLRDDPFDRTRVRNQKLNAWGDEVWLLSAFPVFPCNPVNRARARMRDGGRAFNCARRIAPSGGAAARLGLALICAIARRPSAMKARNGSAS